MIVRQHAVPCGLILHVRRNTFIFIDLDVEAGVPVETAVIIECQSAVDRLQVVIVRSGRRHDTSGYEHGRDGQRTECVHEVTFFQNGPVAIDKISDGTFGEHDVPPE